MYTYNILANLEHLVFAYGLSSFGNFCKHFAISQSLTSLTTNCAKKSNKIKKMVVFDFDTSYII